MSNSLKSASAVTDFNRAVVQTLCERLGDVWHHFLYLQKTAERKGLATPSTAPCSPAPSRQLLIMRDDIQAAPSGMFLSFDGILSSAGNPKANPYEKHSSQNPNIQGGLLVSAVPTDEYGGSSGGAKKKWGLLKSINPFSSLSGDKSSATASERKGSAKASTQAKTPTLLRPATSGGQDSRAGPPAREKIKPPPVVPYRSLSFKFSLEWVDKESQPSGKDRRLSPPSVPPLAEGYAKARDPGFHSNEPRKPEGSAVGPSRYAGRALAEWEFLVIECQNFFQRRRAEGVPSSQLVEIPSLSVEPFRKM